MYLWLPSNQALIMQFVISIVSLLLEHPKTSLNTYHIDVHVFGYAKLLFQHFLNVVMKCRA
jgi:hypothetical protein